MTGSIGVLLPARLETRFDQRPDDGHWILRVIVVPGEASLDVHDPSVDRDELSRLRSAAERCDGQFESEDGAAAFESLAGEVGGGRALWLVRTHLVRDADGWQVTPNAPSHDEVVRAPATLRGLPRRLELWAEANDDEVLLKRLRPRQADLPVTPPDTDVPENERPQTFWASWKILRRAGLAVSVDLTKKGVEPADITRLLVVGVGATSATDLFTAHAESGEAALLRPGTPTNVTAGSGGHARPTAQDRRALLQPPPATVGPSANQDLARALTGRDDGLPRLVGGDVGHRARQNSLVQAVWPALWGHAAQDLWGPSDQWASQRLGYWLAAYLMPQGPFPTLLVDDQPYGVLPLTPLGSAADGTDPVQDRVAPALIEALAAARALASEERHTVVGGADQERLLRVVGNTPTSRAWSWRWSLPLQFVANGLADPNALLQTQREAVKHVLGAAGQDPDRAAARPVTIGRRRSVDLPAAEPTAHSDDPATEQQWDQFMRWLDEVLGTADGEADPLRRELAEHGKEQPLRIILGHLWHRVREARDRPDVRSLERCLEGIGDPWPDSLLYHLAHLSLREVWRWGRWAAEGLDGPPSSDGRTLRDFSSSFPNPGAWVGDPVWALEIFGSVVEGLLLLAMADHGERGDVDRAAAALYDSATHRLDPWAVALGWRRLNERDDAARVLGLYAFVDRPFRGEPGLGDRGLVLAPSPDQVKTAAIVRDRAAAQHLPGRDDPERWDMPLDSERIRTSLRLARAVREGAHPAEAWGREYERLLPDDSVVRAFRDAYPAHAADSRRRTCDGLKVGDAIAAGSIEADTAYAPDAETARRFELLASASADLADLLVLEAVHDTVTGGTSQTATALDAAAGLASPPDFRFPMTPAGGTSLRTTVTVAISDVDPDDEPDPARGPAHADPAIARYLNEELGDPAGAEWTWSAEGGGTTTLADLSFEVADLVGVDDVTLASAAATQLGLADAAGVTPPPGLADARRLINLLADCRPPSGPLSDDAVARLEARLARLLASAQELAADLVAAADANPESALAGALGARALRWGLAGPAGAASARLAQQLAGFAPGGDPIADLRTLASLGPVGETARRQVPVLAPLAPPETGPEIEPAWRDVFGRVRPSLGSVPAPWRWRRHPDETEWTGRPDESGKARASDVVLRPADQAGTTVVGILDSWVETIPDREIPVTGAFSFRTPGARAPQAILLAVPTKPDEEIDNATARDVVRQAADLARARSLPPNGLGALGALLPSALLPAAEDGGLQLPGIPSHNVSRGLHVRLEPSPPEGEDLDRALRAEVGDPVWMLARQWQMGEHAGENASSPTEYRLRTSQTPLHPPADREFADPLTLPGEVVLEGASTDVSIGAAPAAGAGPDPWDHTAFWHRMQLTAGEEPSAQLSARDHDGGVADWWSLDHGPLDRGEAANPFTPTDVRRRFRGLPGRMRYPGAPEPGWFSLEDPDQTVIGHMPDPSHVASLFFLDVISGHGTDWYLARLPTPPGHVLTVRDLRVRDSFGDVWKPAEWPTKADGWTTPFHTKDLGALELLAWFATTKPLESDVLEQVLLGVDEDADLLWTVEERVDGHDVPPPRTPFAAGSTAGADHANTTPEVRYQVVAHSPGPWHPYLAETPPGEPRRFRQGRLRVADDDGDPIDAPLPDPTTRFLPTDLPLHDLDPASIAAGGTRLERRWVLARGRDGLPVLWQQRRRLTPRTAPAFLVGHDWTATL